MCFRRACNIFANLKDVLVSSSFPVVKLQLRIQAQGRKLRPQNSWAGPRNSLIAVKDVLIRWDFIALA